MRATDMTRQFLSRTAKPLHLSNGIRVFGYLAAGVTQRLETPPTTAAAS